VTETQEHYFSQKTKADQILDTTEVRSKSYLPEEIGLPQDWLDQRIDILEHTVPVEQNTALIRIAEYSPTKLLEVADQTAPGITLIIFGGGASQAPGTNVKLAVEAEKSLRQLYDQGQSIPNIKRILVVSNPSGAPKEKQHLDQDNLSTSAQLVNSALTQLRIDDQKGTIVMGFSAGGNLAIEYASLIEKQKVDNHRQNPAQTDLVLIEPTGTVENNPGRMGYEFLIGDMMRNFNNYRSQGLGIRESWARAKQDYRVGWATLDGVPSWKAIAKEIFAPHARHEKYAQAFGLEKLAPQAANLGILSQANASQAIENIKGNVLTVQMSGSGMIDHPIRTMWQDNQFKQAKSRAGITIDAPSHGSVMVDRSGKMMDQIAMWLSKNLKKH